MTIRQKVQQNPLTSLAAAVTTIAVTLTAVWAASDLIDEGHTTEAELAQYDMTSHTVAGQQFDSLELSLVQAQLVNKCRWLSDRIDRLRYEIYILERDQASPDFIQSKKTDLINQERVFNALLCAGKIT